MLRGHTSVMRCRQLEGCRRTSEGEDGQEALMAVLQTRAVCVAQIHAVCAQIVDQPVVLSGKELTVTTVESLTLPLQSLPQVLDGASCLNGHCAITCSSSSHLPDMCAGLEEQVQMVQALHKKGSVYQRHDAGRLRYYSKIQKKIPCPVWSGSLSATLLWSSASMKSSSGSVKPSIAHSH